jgi:hypothetical protein
MRNGSPAADYRSGGPASVTAPESVVRWGIRSEARTKFRALPRSGQVAAVGDTSRRQHRLVSSRGDPGLVHPPRVVSCPSPTRPVRCSHLALGQPAAAALRAALAAVLVPDNAPELRLVRGWLDNWSGLGLVIAGMVVVYGAAHPSRHRVLLVEDLVFSGTTLNSEPRGRLSVAADLGRGRRQARLQREQGLSHL